MVKSTGKIENLSTKNAEVEVKKKKCCSIL